MHSLILKQADESMSIFRWGFMWKLPGSHWMSCTLHFSMIFFFFFFCCGFICVNCWWGRLCVFSPCRVVLACSPQRCWCASCNSSDSWRHYMWAHTADRAAVIRISINQEEWSGQPGARTDPPFLFILSHAHKHAVSATLHWLICDWWSIFFGKRKKKNLAHISVSRVDVECCVFIVWSRHVSLSLRVIVTHRC